MNDRQGDTEKCFSCKDSYEGCNKKETAAPARNLGAFPEGLWKLLGKAFLRASLTVEAAVVLPVFLVCAALILQYANVYYDAVRISSAMTQTAEEMAIASYAVQHTEDSTAGTILGIVISSAYANAQVYARTGKLSAVRRDNLLLSSYLEKNDRIDLVMTYQVKSPMGMISVPGGVFLQRACVRGWTGREGSGGSHKEGEAHQHETVYVAENGIVFHRDPNCTHIRLSISQVSLVEAKERRNVYGEIYHACEKCGKGAHGLVYITTDGNRYHSSLECSGLKRTVREVDLREVGDLRPCSRCGG